jgi:hypothetical protein
MTRTHLYKVWFQCGESLAAMAPVLEGSLQPKNDAKPTGAPLFWIVRVL